MFNKILLIVLISAGLVQAYKAGDIIYLSPEQRSAFKEVALRRLQQEFGNRGKRSDDDNVITTAYHELMEAVEERLEERFEEGINFSCIPFSGGF